MAAWFRVAGVAFCGVPLALAQTAPSALEQHLRAAQQAQATQDCHTAAREYGRAAQWMPGSGELRTNEGIALYCDGQMDAAIQALERAESLNATLFAPHLFLGLAWNRSAKYDRSAKELKIALRLNPEDLQANLWLGYTFAAQRQHELAAEQFGRVLALAPRNVDAQYAMAESYVAIGQEKARALASLAPGGSWLLQLAGEQQGMSGDAEGAKATLAEAAKRREVGGNGDEAREKALYEQAREAELKAQAAFAAILRDAPESYRAHEILGDSFAARQQQDAAVGEYREVLRLDPSLPGIHEALGYCLMLQERYADAVAELQAEQQLQPHSAQVLTELGRVQLDSGDGPGAIATLRSAVALNDPPADAYALLGKALLRNGDAQGAIRSLETATAKDASGAQPYYLLARAYRVTGNQQAMEQAMGKFHQLSQDEAAHRAVERTTLGPRAAPPLLSSVDTQDAHSPR